MQLSPFVISLIATNIIQAKVVNYGFNLLSAQFAHDNELLHLKPCQTALIIANLITANEKVLLTHSHLYFKSYFNLIGPHHLWRLVMFLQRINLKIFLQLTLSLFEFYLLLSCNFDYLTVLHLLFTTNVKQAFKKPLNLCFKI